MRNIWDNFKHTNICIMGMPDGEERERTIENLREKIMTANLPNLVKQIDIPDQQAQRVPNKMNLKRSPPRHIVIKMLNVKDKERILKAARERQLVTYKGAPIKLSADFSTETLQAGKDWQEMFTVMKHKDLQPRLALPNKAIISFIFIFY